MKAWGIGALMAALGAAATPAAAFCGDDLSNYVGWTIIYSGKVTGYVDKDGKEKTDFEGCEHGRVLILDDRKEVTCASYGYAYAYRPTITILSDGSSMEACVKDRIYRIRR